jgi:demethylmenaquinone methyltransferase/2-methoxy-6-polyprenyl-1,4-benzoquinol methylase
MERYTVSAGLYDLISAEPVYRVGRLAAIDALSLSPGDRVLDIGCGTGLNLEPLLDAVGPTGSVVGLDRSEQMLQVARRKAARFGSGRVHLVHDDATTVSPARLLEASAHRDAGSPQGFDAVLCTYSLSLMPAWRDAVDAAVRVTRPGGRLAVVDMQAPTGVARVATPVARLACWLGGSDITARPWSAVEHLATEVWSHSLRGGHIQVRVGELPAIGGAGGDHDRHEHDDHDCDDRALSR